MIGCQVLLCCVSGHFSEQLLITVAFKKRINKSFHVILKQNINTLLEDFLGVSYCSGIVPELLMHMRLTHLQTRTA